MANLISKNYLPPAQATEFNTTEWTIRLIFYNLTFMSPDANNDESVVTWCNAQLDSVHGIWCKKAALNFDVNPNIQPRPAQVPLIEFNYTTANAFLPTSNLINGVIWHRVYIVKKYSNGPGAGQGYTFHSGTSQAFTVLDVRAIDDQNHPGVSKNPFLLAHELGHVIGLNHPLASWGPHSIPGNKNRTTIMNDSAPNLNVLTARELLAFNEKTKPWYINLKNALTQEHQDQLGQFQFLISASIGPPFAFFDPD